MDAQEEGNNILAFMKSEGYLQFEIGKKISSTDFYNIYVSWCEDNLEKSRASAGFLHYIKENHIGKIPAHAAQPDIYGAV